MEDKKNWREKKRAQRLKQDPEERKKKRNEYDQKNRDRINERKRENYKAKVVLKLLCEKTKIKT